MLSVEACVGLCDEDDAKSENDEHFISFETFGNIMIAMVAQGLASHGARDVFYLGACVNHQTSSRMLFLYYFVCRTPRFSPRQQQASMTEYCSKLHSTAHEVASSSGETERVNSTKYQFNRNVFLSTEKF